VLQASPFDRFSSRERLDPLGYIVVLSHQDRFTDLPRQQLRSILPEQVWGWVDRFGQIELRATDRWLNRGYGYADNIVCYMCQAWVITILLGREDLLPES
jgi:hypothetical protein